MFLSGGTTSTKGTLPSGVMPAKSCTASSGMGWIAGAVTSALEWTRIVWPSGSAFATAPTPMAPPPRGRFSMMMAWPTLAATCSNTVRGSRSVALPGANGTTTWTRLVGQILAAEVWGAEVWGAEVWGAEVWGAEVWGAEVSAVSGPIIIHTDAVAAIAASAADPHAFRLCTLSPSCAMPRHATPPTGSRASLADRFSHHHRQGDGGRRQHQRESTMNSV